MDFEVLNENDMLAQAAGHAAMGIPQLKLVETHACLTNQETEP
jgi:hypothetical protein